MSSETAPSQRRQTALAVIDAYNKWDIEAIMAVRTDDCVQEIAPSTSFPSQSQSQSLYLSVHFSPPECLSFAKSKPKAKKKKTPKN